MKPTIAIALVFAVLILTACGDNRTHPRDDNAASASGSSSTCAPNLDEQIDASELILAAGATTRFVASPPFEERVVNVAGTPDPKDGRPVWRMGDEVNGDRISVRAVSALSNQWYASDVQRSETTWPRNSVRFVIPFDSFDGSLEAIYLQSEHAIALLGFASRDPNPTEGKTLIVYEAPVDLFRFPLRVGASFRATGKASPALLRGLPYATEDIYEVKVDAIGRLVLRDLTFTQVLRMRIHTITTPVIGQPISTRQVLFLNECLGEVARATSRAGEPEEDFTIATELRRLSP